MPPTVALKDTMRNCSSVIWQNGLYAKKKHRNICLFIGLCLSLHRKYSLCIRDFANWHISTSFSLQNPYPTRHSRHGLGNPSASPDTTTWFSTHCKTGRFDLPNHLFYNPKRAVLPTGMGRSARRHGLGGHTRRPPQNIVPTRTLPFNCL